MRVSNYLLIANAWFISLVLPCSRFMVQDITALSTLYLSFTVMTILFPMSIIVFCSLRILKAALVHYNSINPTSSCEQNQDVIRRTKKNYKAAKTVSIIVGLFVVSWLPSLITGFVHYFNTKGLITQTTTPCGHLLKQQRLLHLQSTHGCIVWETMSSMKHYHTHFDFLKDGDLEKCFFFGSETVKTGSWLCKFITHNWYFVKQKVAWLVGNCSP